MKIYCPRSVLSAVAWGSSVYYSKPVKSVDYDPHLTNELMDGGLGNVKCPQATGRAGIEARDSEGGICASASCQRLRILHCGKWALCHGSKTSRGQEPHPSDKLVHCFKRFIHFILCA